MDIKGAYMYIRDFLYTNKKVPLHFMGEDEWYLEANRELIVPDYQREYRWGEKQLTELLDDIMDKENCYIGQIALIRREKDSKKYYIVDGQQRITSLIILLTMLCREFYIYNDIDNANEYNLHNPQDKKLNFSSNCFTDFQWYISQVYQIQNISENEFETPETDLYSQAKAYIEACQTFDKLISKMLSIKDIEADKLNLVKNTIKKIYNSKISVIIFDNDADYNGESVFLDINEKGLKLDDEDILKAYYFKISPSGKSKEVLETWQSIKSNYFHMQETVNAKKMKLENFANYFLRTKIITKNIKYKFNDFDDKLRCKKEGKKHICSLYNSTDLHNVMKSLSDFLSEISELVDKDSNSSYYKKYFPKEIDSISRQIFKTLFRTIVKSDMKIIWIALIKIWLLRIENNEKLTLSDIIQLFSFYILANISGKRKESTIFSNEFLSAKNINNMYNELYDMEKNILEDKYNKSSVLKNDQYSSEYLSYNIQMFYNEFNFDKKNKLWNISMRQDKFVENYCSSKSNYCKDHFIIQNSNNIILFNGTKHSIPDSLYKYKKRAYNFIYHKDNFKNKDLVTRLDDILNNKDKYNNYGEYEKAYFNYIEKTLISFYNNKNSKNKTWNDVIREYRTDAAHDYDNIVIALLEDSIFSWHDTVCKYFINKLKITKN